MVGEVAVVEVLWARNGDVVEKREERAEMERVVEDVLIRHDLTRSSSCRSAKPPSPNLRRKADHDFWHPTRSSTALQSSLSFFRYLCPNHPPTPTQDGGCNRVPRPPGAIPTPSPPQFLQTLPTASIGRSNQCHPINILVHRTILLDRNGIHHITIRSQRLHLY